MATLDESHVEKKFRNASITQESIQSLSLWVVHHKAQHEKIVNIWFNVLKKCKLKFVVREILPNQNLGFGHFGFA